MQTTPPAIKKKSHRVELAFLLIVGMFVLYKVTGYFYHRTPHFNGSTTSSIDIKMGAPLSPTSEPKVLVQASITSEPACASLLEFLRSAQSHEDHKCSDIGTFTIRYEKGQADTLAFLPGHDPINYEFRFDGLLYRFPREQFYQVLRDAGVDSTKMPESEH